jgi:hypothetical protein|tara:strand:- start:80 stop:487 length:408 start_codon:yes stop_codon:yes gene_type:complete
LKKKYDKALIEIEARKSIEQGMITNRLGQFILSRAKEIVNYSFITNGNKELRQGLVDDAVMRVCEKFMHYYEEDKSAANLIITMIYSTMYNKITGLKWKDVYGQKNKGYIYVVEDGNRLRKLIKYTKDDNLSGKL